MLDRGSFATIPIALAAALMGDSAEATGDGEHAVWKAQWVPVNAAGPSVW